MRPLLTLCMMVKDEAHTIARTLRSAKPHVDRWCILDTGSTDATCGIVLSEMREIPGTLLRGGFVDFARTRNRLLEEAINPALGGAVSEFLLLLDADDILEGGEALRAFLREMARQYPANERLAHVCTPCIACGGHNGKHELGCALIAEQAQREAFYLSMRQGSCAWQSARVVRADAGWRYVGAVHELLCHPERPAPSITIPGVRILHDPPPVSQDRSVARWHRDLVLLEKDIDADPTNARAVYYYALTLMRLGRRTKAIEAFERRLTLGGFWQERYDSAYERARLMGDALDRAGFVHGMLEAHAIDPRRAEPLAALARHYLTRNPPAFGPAFVFAHRAFHLSAQVPDGALFLHADVYEWEAAHLCAWAAWYVGEHDIGERAARVAVERGPEHMRDRLAANLRFYTERKR